MSDLPSHDGDLLSPSGERRLDDVCRRFEAARKAGRGSPVEAYLSGAAGAERMALLKELIKLDVFYRRQRGDAVQSAEYLRRFPELDPTWVDRETSAAPQADPAPAPGEKPGDVAAPPADAPLPAVPGYEVVRRLGGGGMAVVYEARHLRLNRQVAIKTIRADKVDDPDYLLRFRTEAEAVARFQHPNIVQIFEVGDHAGTPFLSMELCPGGSLKAKLGEKPLPAREAAALVETLARAVHAAHGKGVVHRDLKPDNVLFGEGGAPKVSDFGLAKKLDVPLGPTLTGVILGTPYYMAPEQVRRSAEAGPAADVYALGAILYECLTGRPPFQSADLYDTLAQVLTEEPVPVRRLQPRTPRDLETICLKCLRKEPAKRPATAAELAEDLRRFLVGEPIRARPVGAPERAWRWCRRHPSRAGLAAAVTLAAAAALAAGLWYRSDQDRRASQRAAETAEAMRRLDEPWQAARRSRGQGRYPEALEAARRAEALSRDERVADDARKEIAGLVAALEKEVADESRDQRLLDRIVDLDVPVEKPEAFVGKEPPAVDEQMAAAFRDAGLDFSTRSDQELLDYFNTRPEAVRTGLTAGLDLWLIHCRRSPRNADLSARLVKLARAVDPDPVRDELRAIVERVQFGSVAFNFWARAVAPVESILPQSDYNRLLEIARGDPRKLPPRTVQLLASLLFVVKETGPALTMVRQALQIHPDDPGLHFVAAGLLIQDQPSRLADAIAHLETLRALRPGVGCGLALILVRVGRAEEALTLSEELRRLQPEEVLPGFARGAALSALRRYGDAEAAFREEIQRHPDSALLFSGLGYVLLQQDKFAEAEKACARALVLEPDLSIAHNNHALALQSVKKYPEAEEEVRAAVRLNAAAGLPDQALFHSNLGMILEKEKRHAEAMTECRLAVEMDPDLAFAHNNLGMAFAGLERWQEAEESFRKAIALGLDLPLVHSNLALALVKQKKVDEAEAAYQEATRRQPDDEIRAALFNTLGMIAEERDRRADAVEAYRTSVRLAPDVPETYANLGDALRELSLGEKGDAASKLLDESEAAYRDGIRLAPALPILHSWLGLTLRMKGRLPDAVEEYRKAAELAPQDAKNHRNLASAYREAGNPQAAVDEYRKAIKLEPDAEEYHLDLAVTYDTLKETPQAVEEYREAARLKPDDFEANLSLGVALLFINRPAEAVEPLRRATGLKPDDAFGFEQFGLALDEVGQTDKAIRAYQTSAKLDPNNATVAAVLAAGLNTVGRYREAEEAAERAVRLDPGSASSYVSLGIARDRRARFGAAIEAYREAVRLDSKNAPARYYLGDVLRTVGQFAEAADVYRKALELDPKQAGWRLDLATALRRQGLLDEARSVLEQLDQDLPADSPDRPDLQAVQADLEKHRQFDAALADYIAGTKRPADGDEALLLSELCMARGRYGAAARFHAFAFDSDPEWGADYRVGYSFRAARCAVAAACGAEGTEEERRAFHQQARSWLMEQRARLEAAAADETDSVAREKSADALRLWLETPFFQAVRDPDALAKLPEAEQKEWKQFWADVEALVNRLEASEPKK